MHTHALMYTRNHTHAGQVHAPVSYARHMRGQKATDTTPPVTRTYTWHHNTCRMMQATAQAAPCAHTTSADASPLLCQCRHACTLANSHKYTWHSGATSHMQVRWLRVCCWLCACMGVSGSVCASVGPVGVPAYVYAWMCVYVH